MTNTEFCCGTENVSIEQNISEFLIEINVIDEGPFTYCFCPHNLEYVIGPLENAQY
ncbi:MAG: hypothetical protein MI739_10830 [Bacteroidales bacterium]|nr:hypothetical protein [Bacteroidales bacterium]